MTLFSPVTLQDDRVALVPLAHAHAADLTEAVKDGELWKLWYTAIPAPEKMTAENDHRLALQAQGSMLPFTVIDRTRAHAVGMTPYRHCDAANTRVAIGATWHQIVGASRRERECQNG